MQLWLSLLSVKYFDLENVCAEICPSSILWFLSTHWFSFSWNKFFIRLTKCVWYENEVSIRELSFVDRSLIRVGDDRQSDNWKSSDGLTININFLKRHNNSHSLHGCRLSMAWNVPYLPTHPYPQSCQSLVGFRDLMMAFLKNNNTVFSALSRKFHSHGCVIINGGRAAYLDVCYALTVIDHL